MVGRSATLLLTVGVQGGTHSFRISISPQFSENIGAVCLFDTQPKNWRVIRFFRTTDILKKTHQTRAVDFGVNSTTPIDILKID